MKIRELYFEAYNNNHYSLKLLIHYLVKEKRVLSLEDDEERLNHYLQDRFANKLNQYLYEYEGKLNK